MKAYLQCKKMADPDGSLCINAEMRQRKNIQVGYSTMLNASKADSRKAGDCETIRFPPKWRN